MPVLKNTKHELFAQAVAKGKSQDAAYKEAGYKPSIAHASRLAANGKVMARVRQLTEAGAQKAELDVSYVLDGIRGIVETCSAGETFQPTAALKGHELLGKHLGLFKERLEHSGPDGEPLQAIVRIERILVGTKN